MSEFGRPQPWWKPRLNRNGEGQLVSVDFSDALVLVVIVVCCFAAGLCIGLMLG